MDNRVLVELALDTLLVWRDDLNAFVIGGPQLQILRGVIERSITETGDENDE